MIQQLRNILNINTLEDKLIEFNNSQEEIEFKKSELNELASEYQINSQNYLNTKSQLQVEIEKGNRDSELIWNKVDDKFQRYLKTYVEQLSEIKKAIDSEQIHIDTLLKDDSLVELIEKAKKINNKTKYSDCIIRNDEGKVLFLKRNNNSDFEPAKLCLPGGHVDSGESFDEAAKRECEEETNLISVYCNELHKYEDDKCIIKYFECVVEKQNLFHLDLSSEIILNNDEHTNYVWLDKDEWQSEDLIMNLKEQLNKIFINEIEKNAIEVIKKGIEQGKVKVEILESI